MQRIPYYHWAKFGLWTSWVFYKAELVVWLNGNRWKLGGGVEQKHRYVHPDP